MSEQRKMNLDELKKSFPSLDDLATKKLLGGWVDPNFKPAPDVPNTGSNPGSTPAGSTTASTSHPTSAGGMYFGDSDYDQGDGGWGDWGDSGPGGDSGGDSNPGGSEGGNGQNSSGDQGQQSDAPVLEIMNVSNYESNEFELYNGFNFTIYFKGSNDVDANPLLPGQSTDVPIDGININGNVYKICGGYNWIVVGPGGILTNYWFPGTWWYQTQNGGHLHDPPDDDWNNLFNP